MNGKKGQTGLWESREGLYQVNVGGIKLLDGYYVIMKLDEIDYFIQKCEFKMGLRRVSSEKWGLGGCQVRWSGCDC